jgi:hypothetical protein
MCGSASHYVWIGLCLCLDRPLLMSGLASAHVHSFELCLEMAKKHLLHSLRISVNSPSTPTMIYLGVNLTYLPEEVVLGLAWNPKSQKC